MPSPPAPCAPVLSVQTAAAEDLPIPKTSPDGAAETPATETPATTSVSPKSIGRGREIGTGPLF